MGIFCKGKGPIFNSLKLPIDFYELFCRLWWSLYSMPTEHWQISRNSPTCPWHMWHRFHSRSTLNAGSYSHILVSEFPWCHSRCSYLPFHSSGCTECTQTARAAHWNLLTSCVCSQKIPSLKKEYLHHVGKYTQNEHNLSCYYNCLVMFKNNTLRVQSLFILQCMQISHFVKQDFCY